MVSFDKAKVVYIPALHFNHIVHFNYSDLHGMFPEYKTQNNSFDLFKNVDNYVYIIRGSFTMSVSISNVMLLATLI